MPRASALVYDFSTPCSQCHVRHTCPLRPVAEWARNRYQFHRDRQLPNHQRIFLQGQRAEALFVLRSGFLKSFISIAEGFEQVVCFHLPGDIVGFDVHADDTHSSTVESLVHSMCCRIPMQLVEKYAQRDANIYRNLSRYAATEVARANYNALRLLQHGAEERVAAFILQMSSAFAKRGFSASEFNLPMPRYDIASYLDIAVETVSREFSRLRQAGLIDVQGRFVRIRSFRSLRAIGTRWNTREGSGNG